MKRIYCINCKQNNDFNEWEIPPKECIFCFIEFNKDIKIDILKSDSMLNIKSLRLICQKTFKHIELPLQDKLLLGRANCGSELFEEIRVGGKPVISRLHASIENLNNTLYIKDEGSLNGTFVGAEKINCKDTAQCIGNNSLIFFGQEPFLLHLEYETEVKNTENKAEMSIYLCKNCGLEISFLPADKLCPQCKSFNSFALK